MISVFPEEVAFIVVDFYCLRRLLPPVWYRYFPCSPVNEGVISLVFKDFDRLVLVPPCLVWFFHRVLRPVVKRDVESEWKIFVTVLIEVVRNVFFVNPVLVPVDPMIPDNVVDQLFFQRSAKLIYRLFDPESPFELVG